MKYAKVVNTRVVGTASGLKPDGKDWLPVVKKWEAPLDYPMSFYITDSNVPRLAVVGGEVHETWGFNLKQIDHIKSELYKELSNQRWELEEAGFGFNGVTIPASPTAQVKIPEMPISINSFKISDGVFLTLEDTQPLKDALVSHIQSCYEWENLECDKVSACNTHDELKNYLDNS